MSEEIGGKVYVLIGSEEHRRLLDDGWEEEDSDGGGHVLYYPLNEPSGIFDMLGGGKATQMRRLVTAEEIKELTGVATPPCKVCDECPTNGEPDNCPGDKSDAHAVMTNIPRGVTRGVSWRIVSEHDTWHGAVRAAQILTAASYRPNEWNGQAYRVTHHTNVDNSEAGNSDPHEFFDWDTGTEDEVWT